MATTKVAIAPMKAVQIPKAGADFQLVEREGRRFGLGRPGDRETDFERRRRRQNRETLDGVVGEPRFALKVEQLGPLVAFGAEAKTQ